MRIMLLIKIQKPILVFILLHDTLKIQQKALQKIVRKNTELGVHFMLLL